MKVTKIDGAVLTPESILTINRFQDHGIEGHVEVLEQMIDYMLAEGDVPSDLKDPRVRLSLIQELRYLEKLLITFKIPNNNEH